MLEPKYTEDIEDTEGYIALS